MPKARVTSESTEDRYMSVLYQGGPKTGKTHNALTWPDPLVLYTESNMATLEKFPGVPYLVPADWAEGSGNIIPGLERLILELSTLRNAHEIAGRTVRTIVFDSATAAFSEVVRIIQGPKDSLTQQDWGRVLTRCENLLRQLIDLTKPAFGKKDLPRYNVVVTVHERDVTDDKGSLISIRPAVAGQVKDIMARWFDTVLLCRATTEAKTEKTPAGSRVWHERNFHVLTVPPNEYYQCGDGVGGGVFNVLPSRMDGTYESLAKAWGLKDGA